MLCVDHIPECNEQVPAHGRAKGGDMKTASHRLTRALPLSALACVSLSTALASGKGPGANAKAPTNSESRIARGFELAPVPLDLRGKNRALVGLGSYLVHTHACSDCHTNPPFADGGNPFDGEPEQTNTDGYLAGGTQFGPFLSRNITPRANGLPGG
jgi:hypothetical protein